MGMMKAVVRIPRQARCLVLEDQRARIEWFRSKLPNCKIVSHARDAKAALAAERFAFIFLDHDLSSFNPELDNGLIVARGLRDSGSLGENVLIHSWNSTAAADMAFALQKASAIRFGHFDIELVD